MRTFLVDESCGVSAEESDVISAGGEKEGQAGAGRQRHLLLLWCGLSVVTPPLTDDK